MDSDGSSPFRPARSSREWIREPRALRAARTCGGGERGISRRIPLRPRPFTPRTPNTSQEGPRVRIPFPPAESLSLGGLYLRGSRTPAFRAGFEAAFSARSAESCRARKHRADPQQYLCRAIFQYRISRDAVATSCWVKVAGRVPKRDRACSGLRDAGGSCEFGLRSSKAERCPLIVPGKRQT